MAKVKKSPTAPLHREPIEKRTTQGAGRRSRAKPGRKRRYRGQGRG